MNQAISLRSNVGSNAGSNVGLRPDIAGATVICAQAAIIGYVLTGWLAPSRIGLFFYTLALPLIVLQWLVMGGLSIGSRGKDRMRADRHDSHRGPLFQRALYKMFGWKITPAAINIVLILILVCLWRIAFIDMFMIPTSLD